MLKLKHRFFKDYSICEDISIKEDKEICKTIADKIKSKSENPEVSRDDLEKLIVEAIQEKEKQELEEDRLTFDDKNKAERYRRKLQVDAERMFDRVVSSLIRSLNKALDEASVEICGNINGILDRDLSGLRERSRESGFQFSFNVSKESLSGVNVEYKALGGVESDQVGYWVRVRRNSVWGGLLRKVDFFDKDWGYDDVRRTKDVYVVSNSTFFKEVEDYGKELKDSVSRSVDTYMQTEFKERLESGVAEVEQFLSESILELSREVDTKKKETAGELKVRLENLERFIASFEGIDLDVSDCRAHSLIAQVEG